MFSKEELKEIKLALNSMIASRQTYKAYETNEVRLADNERYLLLDYALIQKIVKLEEE
ncbi:MAG: hypothetical protein ACRDD7_06375 [Peptostreptococcaceae bacterium]